MLVYKIWIQYTNLFKSYGTETIFQSWKRAITPKIINGFYSKSNLTYILWLYTCVQNFNPIHQSFQKISHGNHFSKLKFFKVEKGHNSQNNWWILPLIELGLHFLIIYLCIKFQSNIPILWKDIARKPEVLSTGRDGHTYGQQWYYMPPHWKWRGIKTGNVKSCFLGNIRKLLQNVICWNFYPEC